MFTIAVRDTSGNPVFDPEGAINRSTNLSWETAAPKGYMAASFQVRRADVWAEWAVKASHGVVIYYGSDIVYQGRIETLPITMQGTDEYVTVNCTGWWVVLEERDLRKRWIDNKATQYVRWHTGMDDDDIQNTFLCPPPSDNRIQVFMGSGDILRREEDSFRLRYDLPYGGRIRRVGFNWIGRTGEKVSFQLRNDATLLEYRIAITGGDVTRGTANHTFTQGDTTGVVLRWGIERRDLYDQNDWLHIRNLRVEAHYETGHTAAANPLYKQGELVQDVILLANQKGAQLSSDFSQLGEPGLILDPFAVEEPEYCAGVIGKILSYGDADLNTWIPAVWDETDTSDSKPRFVLAERSTDDYEYEVEVSGRELAALNYEKISSELFNSVTVSYEDSGGFVIYRTSADNAALADDASKAAEYQRDFYFRLGRGDATRADYVGSRFIQFHKDRLTRAGISIRGFARTKGGGVVPACRVRATQRFKLVNTGEIFYIAYTRYDAESDTVQISPDLPQDNLNLLLLQRERGLGRLV